MVLAVPAVALVRTGDGGDNTLRGSAKSDRLDGRAGDDRLRGKGGDDKLRGGAGADDIGGGSGDDRINAGRGPDLIVGGEGDDNINAGRGQDLINVGVDGAEIPSPGNDVIDAVDGERDEISCGEGVDTVFVDRVEDGVYDCEEIIEP